MNSTSQPPVIFLAFANEYSRSGGYLRHLVDEANQIQKVLEPARRKGLCEVCLRIKATPDEILDVFQDPHYRDRITIFHYGGHAEDYGLLLSEADGQTALTNTAGLAAFLGQQKGLRSIPPSSVYLPKAWLRLVMSGGGCEDFGFSILDWRALEWALKRSIRAEH